jgi:hypothetical protein
MPTTPAYVHQAAAVLALQHQPATRNEYGACNAPGFVVVAGIGPGDRARVHHQLPPVDFTDPDRQDSYQRWHEQGERVAEYAETLEAAGWTVERRVPFSGPILLAVPPAPLSPTEELAALLEVAVPTPAGDVPPADLRRLAELVELVHGATAARPAWERAAAAGDRDAVDYLAVLEEEELSPEETGELENSLLYWLGPRDEEAAGPDGACALCDVVKPDRPALRDHVLNVHPGEFCGIYHRHLSCGQAGR